MPVPGAAADQGQVDRAAVVILNWRRPSDTLACIASVTACDYENLDVMVCDNNSDDGSFEAIVSGIEQSLPALNESRHARGMRPFRFAAGGQDFFKDGGPADDDTRRLWVIQTGANGGYAFGNNVGIKAGLACPDVEYFWILNNDTTISAGALGSLVRRMTEDVTIGMCGCTVVYQDFPERVQTLAGGRFRLLRARCELIGQGASIDARVDPAGIERRLSYVNGAACLVRTSLIEDVGYMDEGYFLYWEEMDWATRAARQHYRLGFCPEALVYHKVGASIGTSDEDASSPLSDYYLARSRFRFLRLHKIWLLPLALPLLIKSIAIEFAHGRPQRANLLWTAAMDALFGAPTSLGQPPPMLSGA